MTKKRKCGRSCGETFCAIFKNLHAVYVTVLFCSVQKVADDKGPKAKKGGPKGRKEDGPAQNGETKTNEV